MMIFQKFHFPHNLGRALRCVQDEFQIVVNGIALGLVEPHKMKLKRKLNAGRSLTDDDLIFNLEEEQHSGDLAQNHGRHAVSSVHTHSIRETGSLKCKSKSSTTAAATAPARPKFSSLRLERHAPTTDVSRSDAGQESDKSFDPSAPPRTNRICFCVSHAMRSPPRSTDHHLSFLFYFSPVLCWIPFAFVCAFRSNRIRTNQLLIKIFAFVCMFFVFSPLRL